ncbi:Uncharacterised protein [Escherichia coli]|uniref:Uncharacterized protein n=1 Tax=Escherichia coli TaxID=562 RepID=A0A376KNT2_ECOLX|nr:Uncharacterised protein [Escherichia coli]
MMQAPVITAALLVSPVLMVCLVFCLLAVLLMLILRGGGAKTEMRPDPPPSALPRHRRPGTGQTEDAAGGCASPEVSAQNQSVCLRRTAVTGPEAAGDDGYPQSLLQR